MVDRRGVGLAVCQIINCNAVPQIFHDPAVFSVLTVTFKLRPLIALRGVHGRHGAVFQLVQPHRHGIALVLRRGIVDKVRYAVPLAAVHPLLPVAAGGLEQLFAGAGGRVVQVDLQLRVLPHGRKGIPVGGVIRHGAGADDTADQPALPDGIIYALRLGRQRQVHLLAGGVIQPVDTFDPLAHAPLGVHSRVVLPLRGIRRFFHFQPLHLAGGGVDLIAPAGYIAILVTVRHGLAVLIQPIVNVQFQAVLPGGQTGIVPLGLQLGRFLLGVGRGVGCNYGVDAGQGLIIVGAHHAVERLPHGGGIITRLAQAARKTWQGALGRGLCGGLGGGGGCLRGLGRGIACGAAGQGQRQSQGKGQQLVHDVFSFRVRFSCRIPHSCDRVVSILHFFGRIYNFFLWYVHYINTLDFIEKA